MEGRGRSDRRCALSFRGQARHGSRGGDGRCAARRRHPLRSEHKFMATLNRAANGEEMLLGQGRAGSDPRPLRRQETPRPRAARSRSFRARGDRLAAQGERVLGPRLAALAGPSRREASTAEDLPKTLVLLGLVGLMDPPRKEAIDAVKECHDGGCG